MKRTGTGDGEIIEVQGGHIIRATGRKDRHSKVYTAKGPRDRRVRLSAHTAIQFYDVQDRLGYDRPSKAVDWLINKAKNAIDKLSQSPPNEVAIDPSKESNEIGSTSQAATERKFDKSSSKYAVPVQNVTDLVFLPNDHLTGLEKRDLGGSDLRGNSSLIMAPPAEIRPVADSMMKSFFPLSSGNSLMNLQSYSHDRVSRTGIQTGDLGLSLQTLQDGNLNHRSNYTDEVLLSGTNSVPFEANYAKNEEWNGPEDDETRHVGFIFNPNSMSQQLFYGQNSAFSQRESLQSNYPHLINSWNERQFPSEDQQNAQAMHQSSLYSLHFGSNFQVPARIHGEDEPGIQSIQPSSSVSPGSQQL